MTRPGMLSASACAVLRSAVDEHRSLKRDSVDGAAEHELVLDLSSMTALIGVEEARKLCSLGPLFERWRAGAGDADTTTDIIAPVIPTEVFVRRYTADTRPWIPFHADSASLTVNVALGASSLHGGGDLVAVADGRIVTIEREEGDATVHDSRLLHAVTRARSGVRYSLIIFSGPRGNTAPATAASSDEPPRAVEATAATEVSSSSTAMQEVRAALASATAAIDSSMRGGCLEACKEFEELAPEVQRLVDAIVLARQRAAAAAAEAATAGGISTGVAAASAATADVATPLPRPSTLAHVATELSTGSRVVLTGLSNASLNGYSGIVAAEEPAWTGDRYKIDAEHQVRSAPGRMLVRPRNLRVTPPPPPPPPPPVADGSSSSSSSHAPLPIEMHEDVAPPPCAIRLRLHPSMLPLASDHLRWEALHAIGYDGSSSSSRGQGAPAATTSLPEDAMETFELSVTDWHSYGLLYEAAWGRSALSTDAARARAIADDEPPSLLQLKLFLALLVAPSAALSHFLDQGRLPNLQLGNRPLGRSLVALIDRNLTMMTATREGAERDEAAAVAASSRPYHQQLRRWRGAVCRQFQLPESHGPSPVECWHRTLLRAARRPTSPYGLAAQMDVAGVARRASHALMDGNTNKSSRSGNTRRLLPIHVEEGWLIGPPLHRIRDAVLAYAREQCKPAGIGPAGALDASARACAATDLLGPNVAERLPDALLEMACVIDRLRIELACESGRPLLDVAELQVLLYPKDGGHYRRHVDMAADSTRAVTRSVSFVLYLTDDDFDVTCDGGQLRMFELSDDGTASCVEGASSVAMEVPPKPGTLVLFDSKTVPHAVVPTRRERLCVAGWFCVQ